MILPKLFQILGVGEAFISPFVSEAEIAVREFSAVQELESAPLAPMLFKVNCISMNKKEILFSEVEKCVLVPSPGFFNLGTVDILYCMSTKNLSWRRVGGRVLYIV